MLREGAGARLLLLACEEPDALDIVVHDRKDARAAGEAVPAVAAGEGLAAVPLPARDRAEETWLSVSDLSGTTILPLPEAIGLPARTGAGTLVAKVPAAAGRAARSGARRLWGGRSR